MSADLTVLVPCFNEEARIGPCLHAIQRWHADRSDIDLEVVAVDDGSTDATTDRIDAAGSAWDVVRRVSLAQNTGKGAALREGVAASTGRRVVFFDADLAVDVSHLDRALATLDGGADLAVGCRNVPGAAIVRPQGTLRRSLGRGYLKLTRWFLGIRTPDITCGFKGFRGDVARALFARTKCRRFGIDAEVLALAERAGYRVEPFAVTWVDGDRSSVRIGRDLPGSLSELVATRFRIGFGGRATALTVRDPEPVRSDG